MKAITNKVVSRVAHTRLICNILSDGFTKQDYELQRTLQAEILASRYLRNSPCPSLANDLVVRKKWTSAMKRNEGAFSFDSLRKDGFIIVDCIETVTKEVDWFGYLEDENGNTIDGSYGRHKRTIEFKRPLYRFSENIEDFFAEMLDKISNL